MRTGRSIKKFVSGVGWVRSTPIQIVTNEIMGDGIRLRGEGDIYGRGVVLRGGKINVGKALKRVAKGVKRFVTSKPFRNVVRAARKNIITPALLKLAPQAISALPGLLKAIPGVGAPASLAASAFSGQLNSLAKKGIEAGDKFAESKGYGVRIRGGNMPPSNMWQANKKDSADISLIKKGFVLDNNVFKRSLPISVPKRKPAKQAKKK